MCLKANVVNLQLIRHDQHHEKIFFTSTRFLIEYVWKGADPEPFYESALRQKVKSIKSLSGVGLVKVQCVCS
jgi:hypothetical protein